MTESKEELKNLLMKVKESEKIGLKFNIQKTKIMVSGPISSWQIDGETMELLEIKGNKNEMTDFNLWTPKSLWMMTAAMKLRHLLSLRFITAS